LQNLPQTNTQMKTALQSMIAYYQIDYSRLKMHVHINLSLSFFLIGTGLQTQNV